MHRCNKCVYMYIQLYIYIYIYVYIHMLLLGGFCYPKPSTPCHPTHHMLSACGMGVSTTFVVIQIMRKCMRNYVSFHMCKSICLYRYIYMRVCSILWTGQSGGTQYCKQRHSFVSFVGIGHGSIAYCEFVSFVAELWHGLLRTSVDFLTV